MSFCEDDCEMSRMLARTLAVAANVLAITSGTPTIPGPPTVIRFASFMAVIALTPLPLGCPDQVIFVHCRSGAKLLQILTGIRALVTGRSVFGCSTLAPKKANSAASL